MKKIAEKTRMVRIVLAEKDYEELQGIADSDRRSLSGFGRLVIQKFLSDRRKALRDRVR